MLPTSSRWMVWNGFTTPPGVETPWLVYWPVTNGTSWAILISASSLSSVTIDGVAMMLVLPMPPMARMTAASWCRCSRLRRGPWSGRSATRRWIRVEHPLDDLTDAGAVDRLTKPPAGMENPSASVSAISS